MLHIINLFNK